MSYVPLVDAFHASKEYRTEITPGERCLSIESPDCLGAPMRRTKAPDWELLDFFGLGREREPEREVEA